MEILNRLLLIRTKLKAVGCPEKSLKKGRHRLIGPDIKGAKNVKYENTEIKLKFSTLPERWISRKSMARKLR